MSKNNILLAFNILCLISIVISLNIPHSYADQKELTWTVPENVSKIRVSSTKDDKKVMSVVLNVEPGQIFKVEEVK